MQVFDPRPLPGEWRCTLSPRQKLQLNQRRVSTNSRTLHLHIALTEPFGMAFLDEPRRAFTQGNGYPDISKEVLDSIKNFVTAWICLCDSRSRN